MDFRLSDFGRVFSTRPRGREVREELLEALANGDRVVLSFTGVDRVSQSFSDEFLGALLSDIGPDQVLIDGEMVPAVARVLDRAIRRRGFELDALRAVAA